MIQYAERPDALVGWDDLAADRSFYVSAAWLAFSDSDGVARSAYLMSRRAALSSHWSPRESNEDYVAAQMLPGTGPEPALILGGRRGYLSAPLGDDAGLGELVQAALRREPEAEGRWWWPYLTGEDALRVARSTNAVGLHLIGADCLIEVPEGGEAEYLAILSAKQRRTNVRRERRRYVESGLRTVRVRLVDHADRLGPLLSNVQRKYGHDHSPEQMSGLLRRQAAELDDAAVVFLCLPPDDDEPVGFCLAYRHGDELAVRVVGFDYARLRDADEYPNLAVHEPRRFCQQEGLSRLHLGTESYEAKCRRGARVRPLWAVASFGEPDPGATAARAEELAGRLPQHEMATFLAEVRSCSATTR